MDTQDPQGAQNNPQSPPGNRPPPPPPRVQSTPEGGSQPSSQPQETQAQHQSQPSHPEAEGGAGTHDHQQSGQPGYTQPQHYGSTSDRPASGGYSAGPSGSYSQTDYGAPAQSSGGSGTHEQPTQAYGYGQGHDQAQGQSGYGHQGGYGTQGQYGYPGYPQQQGGTQYNVNAPKKRSSAALWGAIGALAVALIGGGVLLYFLVFAPKSNTPAGGGVAEPTKQATSVTQPTTAAQPTSQRQPTGQPTRRSGIPTAARPTIMRPTSPVLPTRANPRATTRPQPGGGGFSGSPQDAMTTFFGYLKSGDYASAQVLLDPEIAQGLDPSMLQQIWEPLQQTISGDVQVGAARESGDTATVDLTIPFFAGINQLATASLKKRGDKWYIVEPFNISDQPMEIPTFDPGEMPTFEVPTFEPFDQGTPVLP